jgi:hypothetical protein
VVVLLTEAGMTSVEYPRRFIKTRRQLGWQCAISLLALLPALAWRIATARLVVAMALVGLALVAVTFAVRGLRFLAAQEREHPQPTPEMSFVFMLVAVYPPAASTFLLVLLFEM